MWYKIKFWCTAVHPAVSVRSHGRRRKEASEADRPEGVAAFREIFLKVFSITLLVLPLTLVGAPKLTVIFVLDGVSKHQLENVDLSGGIKLLLDGGVSYENAYFPHAMPATATGHAALSTGCYAKDHGFTGNKWLNPVGKKIVCDDDMSKKALVFGKNGELLEYGKSAKNLMVEGLSDQVVLNEKTKTKVFSFSLKSRAAIATASDLGKAVWYDENVGAFTTSKAYFDVLPEWLSDFNKKNKNNSIDGDYYDNGVIPPRVNEVFLNLALGVIKSNFSKKESDNLLVWVSISATDQTGHIFGPGSCERKKMLKDLDAQIGKFIESVQKIVNRKEILFVLTADHGISAIPEVLNKKGIKSARRINENDLTERLKNFVRGMHDIDNLIVGYQTPQFYLNEGILNQMPAEKRNEVLNSMKDFLAAEPGIKKVWTREELLRSTFEPNEIESFYKNQIYPGRSGHLILQFLPFCHTSKYPAGTAHRTPYNDDTHVPLVFYWDGKFEKNKIIERVSMLRFANTLTQIIEVPKPPASTFDILPGV